MELLKRVKLFLWLACTLTNITGLLQVFAEDYDHSFSNECLKNPLKPQYNGGLVINPEFDDGLNGWSVFGNNDVNLTKVASEEGNNFGIASNRRNPIDGFSQKFNVKKDHYYVVSGWIQLSDGHKADVAMKYNTSTGLGYAAWVIAQSGCWSMFKGGFTADTSGITHLFFENNNTQTDIWIDSISVKEFTPEEWVSHQVNNIEKIRKSNVAIQVVDSQGKPISNATISLIGGKPNFPFGCAVNKNILNNNAYQNWFFSRFKYTVFENEMKWYSTEPSQGREDYSAADSLLQLVKRNGVTVRGQNIFWDDPKFQPNWVPNLSSGQLSSAASKRINSVVKRYSGQLIHWDVMNENLHFSFFESKLGPDASATYYKLTNGLDTKTTPFLNDFNTIENKGDGVSSPSNYLKKIKQIRSKGYNGPLGIGLESHFSTPDLAYVRSAIDILATAKLPIWITELDVSSSPNQAQFLGQIINEVLSHPAIGGIILWSAWSPNGCFRMCLTDNNFKNLPTGNVVDGSLKTMTHEGLVGTTTTNGFFETSLFHGDYEVKIDHPSFGKTIAHNFVVSPTTETESRLHIKIISQ